MNTNVFRKQYGMLSARQTLTWKNNDAQTHWGHPEY